jgi:hypothetical protein
MLCQQDGLLGEGESGTTGWDFASSQTLMIPEFRFGFKPKISKKSFLGDLFVSVEN